MCISLHILIRQFSFICLNCILPVSYTHLDVYKRQNHDYAVAAISHVPHVIASSLVNLVAQSDFPDGTMKKIAAGGFKDITRIASSSPVMWEQILFTNKDNIISLLEDYKKAIDQTITDLKTDNHKDIYDIFEQSGTYRSSISDKRGSATMNPEYAIFCDIPDPVSYTHLDVYKRQAILSMNSLWK